MLISSLVQFNVDTHNLSSSARLRWEYTGGSELFVVYSDGRDTTDRRLSAAAEPDLCDQGDAARAFLGSISRAEARPAGRAGSRAAPATGTR